MKPLLAIIGSLNIAAGAAIAVFHARLFRLLDLPPFEPALFPQMVGALVMLMGVAFWMTARDPQRHRAVLVLGFAMQTGIVILSLYHVGRGRVPLSYLTVVLIGQSALLLPLGVMIHRLYADERTAIARSAAPTQTRAITFGIRATWLTLFVAVFVPAVWATSRAASDYRRVASALVLQPISVNLPLRAGTITPLTTELAFSALRFTDPTFITPIPDGSDRMLVVERPGRIYAFKNRDEVAKKTVFLDITDRTMQVENRAEDGLFCIAFHPEFAKADSPHRGEFFLHYTAKVDGKRFNRLSKLRVEEGSDTADAASEIVLIDTPDRYQSHNGGTVTFGPDGFLYVTIGDDGHRYPNPHAQNIRNDLFSGILRIDPDCRGGKISHAPPRQPQKGKTGHYYIPNDNPFVGVPEALEEFYAIGLRNPWRISFDPSGRLWASDVGDLRREEINLIEPGANCGWAYTEGTVPCKSHNPAAPSKPDPYLGKETWPIYEYERDAMNRCIIGGYVYRGSQFPELRGKYIYADQSGRIYALTLVAADQPPRNELVAVIDDPGLGVSSLGEDAAGEIFICIIKDLTVESGEIHRLAKPHVDPAEQLPRWLSETKLFDDLHTLKPAAGFVPFEVNSPLWSDRAVKRRWIGLPQGATIEGDLRGMWKFPAGTVFVKHFDLPLDESRSQQAENTASFSPGPQAGMRRLETRILVCDDQDAVYAATYRWKPDLSDAELVDYSQTEDIEYTDAQGSVQTQKWLYPGRFECLSCHNATAGYVLGFSAKQLNRDVAVGSHTENQLARFARGKLLHMQCTDLELNRVPTLVAIDDPHASIETRVRSYLDANCSHCHRPGLRFGAWDARIESALGSTGIIDGTSHMHFGSDRLARIIRPGDLAHSYLWIRLSSNDITQKMPPLGRNVVDERAAKTIAQWIQSMPPVAEDAAKQPEEHR
jgi:uncharacterized repeat protein (TIGR03806 family)